MVILTLNPSTPMKTYFLFTISVLHKADISDEDKYQLGDY